MQYRHNLNVAPHLTLPFSALPTLVLRRKNFCNHTVKNHTKLVKANFFLQLWLTKFKYLSAKYDSKPETPK